MNYKKLIPAAIATWTCLPAIYIACGINNMWSAPLMVTASVIFFLSIDYAIPERTAPTGYTYGGRVKEPFSPDLQTGINKALNIKATK